MERDRVVSIIIPFYNVGNYVKETIKSLESQIYREFEVIFVNDASTDKSLEIVKNSLKKVTFDYKIIDIQKNLGPSAARNTGLSKAEGEYVYFLDSDDILSKDMIKKVMDRFVYDNPDLVFFRFKRIDEEGKVVQNYNEIFDDVEKIKKSRDILKKYINLELFLFTGNVVYRRELLKDICFNEDNVNSYYVEDQDFIIRVLLKSSTVGYIDRDLIGYVQRKGSIMRSQFNLRRLNKVKIFNTFYEEYRQRDSELSRLFLKRRSKEILWVTRFYIKNESNLKDRSMANFLKENILKGEIDAYLQWKFLRELKARHKIQIFLLKYYPYLYVKISKII
ncbi:glycosyltransferase family 2 protein [uncultured Ilyobacter sp.]|uniref:glycosyltransferase family 2 protein n=1 Tax=uncultured Ilyobacter sp. TaxID=544433 RepID=UPI0029C600FE|nr:glycosyltransferase family 2 protein [uncultured Ilyobacter sp.]